MTSTPFNVGLSDSARVSSRVLRPPGGGHTDIFGSEPEPPQRTGRRQVHNAGQRDEQKPTNGTDAPTSNGQNTPSETPQPAEVKQDSSPKVEQAPPAANMEPPKRVRVPPGGFSSGLWLSESTGCGSTNNDDDEDHLDDAPPGNTSRAPTDNLQFPANIDLRYGGQYLTPEQLPEFCNQLHHLVEVIRNIQSYARVTGEYPSELERRLEQEAREVASLAAEARNAREVLSRTRTQRRAVRAQKKHLLSHLASLRETEVRELESTIRSSDRKLYKGWEAMKDSNDPSVFEPLLTEIRGKQSALDCLIRLIENRRSVLARNTAPARPLPPPEPHNDEESTGATAALGGRKRHETGGRRSSYKRRRRENNREPRSVPLSGEPSRHEPPPTQVTLYIQGTESTSRYRVGSAGTVTLTPLELPSTGSVRDILFFTTN